MNKDWQNLYGQTPKGFRNTVKLTTDKAMQGNHRKTWRNLAVMAASVILAVFGITAALDPKRVTNDADVLIPITQPFDTIPSIVDSPYVTATVYSSQTDGITSEFTFRITPKDSRYKLLWPGADPILAIDKGTFSVPDDKEAIWLYITTVDPNIMLINEKNRYDSLLLTFRMLAKPDDKDVSMQMKMQLLPVTIANEAYAAQPSTESDEEIIRCYIETLSALESQYPPKPITFNFEQQTPKKLERTDLVYRRPLTSENGFFEVKNVKIITSPNAAYYYFTTTMPKDPTPVQQEVFAELDFATINGKHPNRISSDKDNGTVTYELFMFDNSIYASYDIVFAFEAMLGSETYQDSFSVGLLDLMCETIGIDY